MPATDFRHTADLLSQGAIFFTEVELLMNCLPERVAPSCHILKPSRILRSRSRRHPCYALLQSPGKIRATRRTIPNTATGFDVIPPP